MRDGSRSAALRDMTRLVREVRRRRFDLVIDFHSFRETNLLTWLSGAPVRIGMKRYKAPYLNFSFNRPPVHEDKSLHVATMFEKIVETIIPLAEAVNKSGPSPSGGGRRDSQRAAAPGEGHKSDQIFRPSPYLEASSYRARASHPLPEGEGESSAITIFHSPIDRAYSCRVRLFPQPAKRHKNPNRFLGGDQRPFRPAEAIDESLQVRSG